MIAPGEIVLITGIMAAGKSTVAQALAERLPRSVHLRGDLFRRMIVNGQAAITPENWDEAERQVHLRYRIASRAAVDYAAAGFSVIYQDVILGADLQMVIDMLDPRRQPVAVVVLVPTAEVAARRDRERAKTGYGDWTAEDLDAGLRRDTPRTGLWLDTTHLTVEETVDTIMRRHREARVPAGPAT
jgi:chloramphenicol 3-O-phosphotransferase